MTDEIHRTVDGQTLEFTDEDGQNTISLNMLRALADELEANDAAAIKLNSDVDADGHDIEGVGSLTTEYAESTNGIEFLRGDTYRWESSLFFDTGAAHTISTSGSGSLDREGSCWELSTGETADSTASFRLTRNSPRSVWEDAINRPVVFSSVFEFLPAEDGNESPVGSGFVGKGRHGSFDYTSTSGTNAFGFAFDGTGVFGYVNNSDTVSTTSVLDASFPSNGHVGVIEYTPPDSFEFRLFDNGRTALIDSASLTVDPSEGPDSWFAQLLNSGIENASEADEGRVRVSYAAVELGRRQ